MSMRAGGDETAAPFFREQFRSLRTDIFVIAAGHQNGRKGQGYERNGAKAGGSGREGRGFYITGRHEEGSFYLTAVPDGPMGDGDAGQAVTNEDGLTGRKGGDDFVDGVDPVVFIRVVPFPLMDTGKAM